jgi:hypothetical protein
VRNFESDKNCNSIKTISKILFHTWFSGQFRNAVFLQIAKWKVLLRILGTLVQLTLVQRFPGCIPPNYGGLSQIFDNKNVSCSCSRKAQNNFLG